MRIATLLASLTLLAAAPAALAQEVGSAIPEFKFKSLHQSQAQSLEDYAGRVVLLEFFAHW